MAFYYFTAFTKNTSRIGRRGPHRGVRLLVAGGAGAVVRAQHGLAVHLRTGPRQDAAARDLMTLVDVCAQLCMSLYHVIAPPSHTALRSATPGHHFASLCYSNIRVRGRIHTFVTAGHFRVLTKHQHVMRTNVAHRRTLCLQRWRRRPQRSSYRPRTPRRHGLARGSWHRK